MTKDSIIAFIEMQFALLMNPAKKVLIQRHIRMLKNQNTDITDYLQTELNRVKKISAFEKQWLQLVLQLFRELENDMKQPHNQIFYTRRE